MEAIKIAIKIDIESYLYSLGFPVVVKTEDIEDMPRHLWKLGDYRYNVWKLRGQISDENILRIIETNDEHILHNK